MTINKYNSGHMYDLLVKSNNDIVGFFAYILYKQEKIAYIKKVNKDKKIPDKKAEMTKWKNAKCIPKVIENYRKLAESQANNFGADYSKRIGNDLEKKAKKLEEKEAKLIKREIQLKKASFHGFGYGVAQGAVASLILPAIIALVVFISKIKGENLGKAFSAFFETLTQ